MTELGDIVRFNGQYTYCGTERHGMFGRVDCIFDGVIRDERLAVVTEYLGTYSNGMHAYGIGVPLPLDELEPAEIPDRVPPKFRTWS